MTEIVFEDYPGTHTFAFTAKREVAYRLELSLQVVVLYRVDQGNTRFRIGDWSPTRGLVVEDLVDRDHLHGCLSELAKQAALMWARDQKNEEPEPK